MRISIAATITLLAFPAFVFAHTEGSKASAERRHHVIEITDSGIMPGELDISADDLSVFILNSSTRSLVTFEIDYGKREIHCSSDGIKNLPNGIGRSSKPLGPRDFVATCFHDPGEYPIKFYGVNGRKDPVTVSVVLR